jgi:hypothetical protein
MNEYLITNGDKIYRIPSGLANARSEYFNSLASITYNKYNPFGFGSYSIDLTDNNFDPVAFGLVINYLITGTIEKRFLPDLSTDTINVIPSKNSEDLNLMYQMYRIVLFLLIPGYQAILDQDLKALFNYVDNIEVFLPFAELSYDYRKIYAEQIVNSLPRISDETIQLLDNDTMDMIRLIIFRYPFISNIDEMRLYILNEYIKLPEYLAAPADEITGYVDNIKIQVETENNSISSEVYNYYQNVQGQEIKEVTRNEHSFPSYFDNIVPERRKAILDSYFLVSPSYPWLPIQYQELAELLQPDLFIYGVIRRYNVRLASYELRHCIFPCKVNPELRDQIRYDINNNAMIQISKFSVIQFQLYDFYLNKISYIHINDYQVVFNKTINNRPMNPIYVEFVTNYW